MSRLLAVTLGKRKTLQRNRHPLLRPMVVSLRTVRSTVTDRHFLQPQYISEAVGLTSSRQWNDCGSDIATSCLRLLRGRILYSSSVSCRQRTPRPCLFIFKDQETETNPGLRAFPDTPPPNSPILLASSDVFTALL